MSGDLTLNIAPHPLRAAHDVVRVPEGLSLGQMLVLHQADPFLARHAVATINGHVIPREHWGRVKPRAGTIVEIRVVPMTGGGGGKSIFRTILMLAVVVASFWAGPAIGTALFGSGILGISGATLGQALVGLVGMLLVNVIAPVRPPSLGGSKQDKEVPTIDGARNSARPFQSVPVILGRHRVAPSYGSSPYTEIVGGKHYLRLLFVWGIGPLDIETDSLKIGDTPLSQFDGVEIEHREGYANDAPLTLYSDTVLQEDMNVTLKYTTGWVTRFTTPEADEIGFDISFPLGLVNFNTRTGDKGPETIRFQVQYRAVGAGSWSTPSYTATTVPSSWISGDTITFTYKKGVAIRDGFRFPVPSRGEYELRIRRTTIDNTDDDGNELRKGVVDQSAWTAFRTFTNEDPIQSAVPVAKTALRIQATDQLNRVIDEFTGIVTSKGKKFVGLGLVDTWPDWDAVTDFDAAGDWVDDQAITNPADLCRLVLQGRGIAEALPDSRLDLAGLADFHVFCDSKGFEFNHIRDFQASVWDTLADVAAAGRAAPMQQDGKWGVVIERERDYPVSHVTPRNSYGFAAEKMWPDLPHAWRVRFPNEDQDWRTDEYRVYRDGYTRANATKFETLELPGVTAPDQVYKLGRFRIAQGILQAERWTFQQDMEHLTYRRGDRIKISHDVLLIGLAQGRIKAVVTDGGNNVLSVAVDEPLEMAGAIAYGISVRNAADVAVTGQVVTEAGSGITALTFATPVPPANGEPAIAAGDLFGFGELGEETDDASVIEIRPEANFKARITAVPYRPAVFDVDSATIPEFETVLTPLPAIPAPVISSIVTDESVLQRGAGDTLLTRMSIEMAPVNDPRFASPRIELQGRPSETGEPWGPMEIVDQAPYRVLVGGVDDREMWDVRVRFYIPGLLLPGPWTYRYNVVIVGKSTPPAAPQNLTISAIGGMAYLRWDEPEELDVKVGGRIMFRHSPEFTGAEWGSSVSIGTAAFANNLFAVLPLKPGTYLARTFDAGNTPSDDVSTVTTKQATVIGYADLDSLDEAPAFAGTHDDTVVVSDTLRLGSASAFDDVPDVDDLTSFDDALASVAVIGTYDFAAGFDFGSVTRVRLTTRIVMTTFSVLDLIDNRTTAIDLWEDIDGTDAAAGDVLVQVRHTDDDPSGSPTWTAWERLDSAEFQARGFDFRAILSTTDDAINVAVSELGVDAQEFVP